MTKKTSACFVILSILIVACQTVGLLTTPIPLSTAATPPTPTSTIIFTPTPTASPVPTAFLALLNAPVAFKAGGFSMAPLRGYKSEINNYQAFLKSQDEKVTLLLLAEVRPSGKPAKAVVKSLAEYLKEVIHDFSEGESRDISIDSVEGISKDYAGTVNEEPLKGRIAILFPRDSKMLTIIVQTVGEGRWESEGESAYSATLEQLSFFKIEISDQCSITKNRDYGHTVEQPIKIGGGASKGPDREQEYLSALLGPRGEIISYYRADDPIKKDGVILDKFIVSYENDYKTLYMDMYNYDNPRTPFGFTCSTTFPMAP